MPSPARGMLGARRYQTCIRCDYAARPLKSLGKITIASGIRNQSYSGCEEQEVIAVAKKFCIYSMGHFPSFISRARFASAEHPGPFQHYQLFCENQVIDVVSIDTPHRGHLEPLI